MDHDALLLNPHDVPVILDFDRSVHGLGEALTLPLAHWQSRIRFSCRWPPFHQLAAELEQALPVRAGCVFTGSGDYHHLSYLLIKRLPASQRVQLIVCDNHPDNMRMPFGIHCGSWIYHASRLPQVAKIHVIGICSQDIARAHAWENHLGPLLRGRLHYWSLGVDCRWISWLGARRSNHRFTDPDRLMAAFLAGLGEQPVYLSIDKDVLSPQVLTTNWDQGRFRLDHLQALIGHCRQRLAGMDITGEVSCWRGYGWVKRLLSAADGQRPPSVHQLADWQQQHLRVNRLLLDALRG